MCLPEQKMQRTLDGLCRHRIASVADGQMHLVRLSFDLTLDLLV